MHCCNRTKVSLLLATMIAPHLLGCSKLSANVEGTVSLDDKPVAIQPSQRGTVMLSPVDGGATCSGLIGPNGEYRISTGGASALAPGSYLASVRIVEIVAPQEEQEAPAGRPISPAVYSNPLTSGLTLDVSAGMNRYDIRLQSSAGPAVLPVETPAPEEESAEGDPASTSGSTVTAEPAEASAAESAGASTAESADAGDAESADSTEVVPDLELDPAGEVDELK